MYRVLDLNSISVNVLTVLIVVTVIVLLSSAKVSDATPKLRIPMRLW